MRWKNLKERTLLALGVVLVGFAASSQVLANGGVVKIGVSISATGPGTAQGTPNKNTIESYPRKLGGIEAQFIVLDDASDPTQAAKNARRFVDADKVDAIIGSSGTTTALAVAEVATESQTPQLSLGPFTPREVKWIFTMPTSIDVLTSALFNRDIKEKGYKKLAFVGFANAFGDAWFKGVQQAAAQHGIEIVADERYAHADQSFTAQALKIVSAKPDFVFIATAGTAGALAPRSLRERGYKGQFYLTYGSASQQFLRAAGQAAEGAIFPTGVVLVAEQIPDDHPSKKVALDYLKKYEEKHGEFTRNVFGGYAQDAYLLLDGAVKVSAKKSKPGTLEFRQALRDALENTKNFPVTHGVVNYSKDDHNGFDEKLGVAIVRIEKGQWKYIK